MGVTLHQRLYDNLTNPQNGAVDAVLFSGGGDDLVGEQFRLWLHDAVSVGADITRAINTTAFADILGVVETAFLDLIATCKAADRVTGRTTLIFVHAYDFALPTNDGVCGRGPWLAPSLEARGWMTGQGAADIASGAQIVKQILQNFLQVLVVLESNPKNNLVVVPTQGVLADTDWANELHPNPGGFNKIATRFAQSLIAKFPGRAALT
jgi:hypothetical protein